MALIAYCVDRRFAISLAAIAASREDENVVFERDVPGSPGCRYCLIFGVFFKPLTMIHLSQRRAEG